MSFTRRHTLAVCLGALAGCAGSSDDESASETARTTEERSKSDTETGTATATPDLDLREANVVGVEIEQESGSQYRFDVTLHHDDDGEEGYANWWEVETRSGEQLGRRELLHAHSTDPFTRSETIEIPDGTECVVVRGHDQTHGYGGQAMLVTLDSGATSAVKQGPERNTMRDIECP